PMQVVHAIEAELSDAEHLVRLGDSRISCNSDFTGEIVLTPSWLICTRAEATSWWYFRVTGREDMRLHVMRLDSIVWMYRVGETSVPVPAEMKVHGAVILFDRTGGRLEIPGANLGLAQLMAELITRLPWALTRFDEETERAWRDN